MEFFRTANPQDEFFLITFSDKPEVLVDFTSSVEDIQSKLVYAVPKGRTALAGRHLPGHEPDAQGA